MKNEPTILLVDDEPDVRDSIAEILREAGYGVLEAANGHEALAASDAHPGKIDLLLTDLIMPGMTGRMLADLLGARRPGIVVVFISGYISDTPGSRTEQGTVFIQKPVVPETLLKMISDALPGIGKDR